jgi:hypothetical protein
VRQFRCDIEDCGAIWTGPSYLFNQVQRRHVLQRHEATAEAEALLKGELLPQSFSELPAPERGCICLDDLYDPDCQVHDKEAVW